MDYTKRAALLCCTCYIILFMISFIPSQKLFGVELRRANVLSDLLTFSADDIHEDVELVIDTEEYDIDLEHVEKQVEAVEAVNSAVESNFEWRDTTAKSAVSEKPKGAITLLKGVEVTPIEDYDSTELTSLSKLYRKLLSPDSLVRIAVLGDSFIEADILTADLRESLQNQYGGCGAGFAPTHSTLMQYRSTIKTKASGWNSYNVMQYRSTPEPYKSHYSVSGWVSRPSNEATTRWETSSVRDNLDSCMCVRVHFLALKDASVEISINDEQSRVFDIKGGDMLRQIELHQSNIRSVTMRVVSGEDGFIGYGAHFDGETGVVVDNYSVRSNNGQAMFWTSPAINAQIDKSLGGYDLVILQYGLNIMQSGVNKYSSYSAQVEKMISFSQKCFPKATILVMGVSDRSMKKDGSYQPMSEAESLTAYQRQAAQNMGVCFWDTHSAMQSQGGMSRFVANGWAAKDYTHINHGGGRQIAWALVDAVAKGAYKQKTQMVKKVEYEPIVDSLSNLKIMEDLLSR